MNNRMWWPKKSKKVWQKHGAEVLNCDRQSYGAAKTIWAHNFSFNWLVLKPNLSHLSFLKSLHKKHAFRTFWGLSGGGRSRFYKRLCTRVSLQNAVYDTSHPETRTSRIESVLCAIVGERNSEHGFVELGWNLTIGQKEQELVEWDRFRFLIYNRMWWPKKSEKVWQKHGAEVLNCAIVRAMGQQKRSERTTSVSIGWFWNQICPIFPS